LPIICSGVNRILPIDAPFFQGFSHYAWTDLRGASQSYPGDERRYNNILPGMLEKGTIIIGEPKKDIGLMIYHLTIICLPSRTHQNKNEGEDEDIP
jgi:hypothetical protein